MTTPPTPDRFYWTSPRGTRIEGTLLPTPDGFDPRYVRFHPDHGQNDFLVHKTTIHPVTG